MRRIIALFILAVVSLLLWSWWRGNVKAEGSIPPTIRMDAISNKEGFARAIQPRPFIFPPDHGPHLEYQTEWWYFTGNLDSDQGEHFGYQLTFFRRGLTPESQPRESSFATNQIYFAHLAITDVPGNSHVEVERFSRGAAGLAGASGEPFHVWLEDWSLLSLNKEGSHLQLSASEGDLGLELELQSEKPIVLHGENGLSPKSNEPGNASYYLSYTRLASSGSLWVNGKEIEVQGQSWFDHEWSTTVLGEKAVGWDWFGLQLNDGRELMFFLIRNHDGSIDPVSSGTLVEPDGSTHHLGMDELQVQILDRWQSPETDAEYPSSWRVIIPGSELDLTIDPWLEDQEMNTSLVYWEGAVKVNGLSHGIQVSGNGYIELTGYAYSFNGVF
jgi:predicted secreted hydrolase